jgi:phospholipase C
MPTQTKHRGSTTLEFLRREIVVAMNSKLLFSFIAIGITAGCSMSGPSSTAGPGLPAPATVPSLRHTSSGSGYIKHVVVIIQENRSFENFFAGWPGANAPMYGYAFHAGKRVRVRLHQTTFETNPNLPHIWQSAITGWDNGKMDGFHTGPHDNYAAYAYMDHAQIAPYRAMAQQYVLADGMFPSEFGGSFASHIMAVAGNDDISSTEAVANTPTLAPNDCDAPPRTRTSMVNSARQIGRGNGPFPCFTEFNSMVNLLDAAKLSWRYYIKRQFNAGLYSPFEAMAYVRYGPDYDADVVAPQTRVLTDIANGQLAAVTWVTPSRDDSDLPGLHSDKGPSWVTAIVNEIGESKFWSSSAIVVVWDEWGGWFDNAPPPQLDFRGLGIRVPCLIISPYAKEGPSGPGYVSHTQYEWASMLSFIEGVYNLGPIGPTSLGYTDTRAKSLADSFDFTQQPRPFTPFNSKYPTSYFLHEPPSNAPVDDE